MKEVTNPTNPKLNEAIQNALNEASTFGEYVEIIDAEQDLFDNHQAKVWNNMIERLFDKAARYENYDESEASIQEVADIVATRDKRYASSWIDDAKGLLKDVDNKELQTALNKIKA